MGILKKYFLSLIFTTLTIILISCEKTSNRQVVSTSNIPLTNSLIPSQTWTPEPTNTPTNTFTPSATPNTLTLTSQSVNATFSANFVTSKANSAAIKTLAYSTLEARKATCIDGYSILSPEDMVKEYSQIKTPTDQWIVLQCQPKINNQKGYTIIVNHNGSTIWKVSYNTFKVPYGYPFLINYGVDSTGKYLYLVPGNISSPSGGNPLGYLFGSGNGLYRLDLKSGEINEFLGEIEDGRYIDISMTKDAHYIAWSTSTEKNTLYLQDLTNSKTTLVKVDESYKIVGALNWSPDNETLIFAASMHELNEDTSGISLFTLNAKTIQLQSLLFNDKRNFVPWFNSNTNQTWFSNDVVNLASYSQEDRWFTNTEWSINIRTGEVIPLPQPTPTP